jgi:two-component system heavy metal sensor histidine kinase CusS
MRQRMTLIFVLALVLSGALTLLIARGVFRPLAALTVAATHVQASRINARIDESGWPAELTSLAREFDAMLARLAESFHRLARFSSDLSHELRTPINNLRGEAEVALSRTRSPEEYRCVLESSLEECARLGRLIDTLLFIAKSDNPERVIVRRELDASTECQAVVDFFEAMASERNLSMLVRGTGRVYGDPELLRRALVNLVDNAVRHTEPGGHVDLAVREGTDHGTEIEVSDNGTGIPSEHLPRVFERFYRSEKSSDEAHATSGFGLGLAIVKSIMDLHDGTVVITSAAGTGTTVTLRFPAGLDGRIAEM